MVSFNWISKPLLWLQFYLKPIKWLFLQEMIFWLSYVCLSHANRHSDTDSASRVVWCISHLRLFTEPSLPLSAAPIMPWDDSVFANLNAFNCLRFHNSTFQVISMASVIHILSARLRRYSAVNRSVSCFPTGAEGKDCVSHEFHFLPQKHALNKSLGLLR